MSQPIRFTFPSTQGPELDAMIWQPDSPPIAVVQIVHGMAQHIERYDRAAQAFNRAGIAVVGDTHQGHGKKAAILGHFESEDGWQSLVQDEHTLRLLMQERFKNIPYFMLGHSMGSFITRCYLQDHGKGLAGAIISGTGYFDRTTVTAGIVLASIRCMLGGAKKPSPLINAIAFASSNKPFEPARTPYDWLTRDEKQVDRYIADEYCGHLFTASGYRELFRGLKRLCDEKALMKMDENLPVLFFSGTEDPVGQMTVGVARVVKQFTKRGMKDVSFHFYPGGRHEMFNEINHDEVERDVIAWVKEKIKK